MEMCTLSSGCEAGDETSAAMRVFDFLMDPFIDVDAIKAGLVDDACLFHCGPIFVDGKKHTVR
jgi:hypothetical protein